MNILSNIICKCTSRQIYILLEMNTTFFMVKYFDFISKSKMLIEDNQLLFITLLSM